MQVTLIGTVVCVWCGVRGKPGHQEETNLFDLVTT